MNVKLLVLSVIIAGTATYATLNINRTEPVPKDKIYDGCCKIESGWPLVAHTEYTSRAKHEYSFVNIAANYLFYLLLSGAVVATLSKLTAKKS